MCGEEAKIRGGFFEANRPKSSKRGRFIVGKKPILTTDNPSILMARKLNRKKVPDRNEN